MGRKNRGTESLDRPESKINEPNTPARTDIPSSSSCGNSPTPLNLGIGVFVIITAMIRITVSIAHLDPSSSSSLSRLGMLGNFAPILGILVFFSCNCKSMCSRAATSYFVLIVFTPLAAGCLVLGGFRGYYFLRLVLGAIYFILGLAIMFAPSTAQESDNDIESASATASAGKATKKGSRI